MRRYAFYHLLSGQDLPLKSQDQIHHYFDSREGVEFVRYASQPIDCLGRVYGHRLWNSFGKNRKQRLLLRIDAFLAKLERPWHLSDCFVYQKGDNWFSISDSFARYVLSKRHWIEETFKNSFCADEVFLQSILWNSPYKQNVWRQVGENNTDANQRLIDWVRGSPYCFTISDLDLLRDSPLMFARKFDSSRDGEVIDAVADLCQIEE